LDIEIWHNPNIAEKGLFLLNKSSIAEAFVLIDKTISLLLAKYFSEISMDF